MNVTLLIIGFLVGFFMSIIGIAKTSYKLGQKETIRKLFLEGLLSVDTYKKLIKDE